jgi:hypothetical protein
MLTSTTLFATFVLYRFMATLSKLNGIENDIETYDRSVKPVA